MSQEVKEDYVWKVLFVLLSGCHGNLLHIEEWTIGSEVKNEDDFD